MTNGTTHRAPGPAGCGQLSLASRRPPLTPSGGCDSGFLRKSESVMQEESRDYTNTRRNPSLGQFRLLQVDLLPRPHWLLLASQAHGHPCPRIHLVSSYWGAGLAQLGLLTCRVRASRRPSTEGRRHPGAGNKSHTAEEGAWTLQRPPILAGLGAPHRTPYTPTHWHAPCCP